MAHSGHPGTAVHPTCILQQITHKTTQNGVAGVQHINASYVMTSSDIRLPEYCFTMNVSDMKSDEVYSQLTIILSALLNTSGGLLHIITSGVTPKVIDEWRNSLCDKLSHIPKWIFSLCLSICAHNSEIFMIVKKTPQPVLITHLYIRLDAVACKSQYPELKAISGAPRKQLHDSTKLFRNKKFISCTEKLPSESKYIEYKCYRAQTGIVLMNQVKDKCWRDLHTLANNQDGGGCLIIGVNDKNERIVGQTLSESCRNTFRQLLTEWINLEGKWIWGDVEKKPSKAKDWDVRFISIVKEPPESDLCLVVITMYQCLGGLYESIPEYYEINNIGHIYMLSFIEIQNILNEDNLTLEMMSGTEIDQSVSVFQSLQEVPDLRHVIGKLRTTASNSSSVATQTDSPESMDLGPVSVMNSKRRSTERMGSIITKRGYIDSIDRITASINDTIILDPINISDEESEIIVISDSDSDLEEQKRPTCVKLSWSESQDWNKYIVNNRDYLENTSKLRISLMQMETPLHTVSELQDDDFYQSLKSQVQNAHSIPGSALFIATISDYIDINRPPADHKCDILICLQNGHILFMSHFDGCLSEDTESDRRSYVLQACRVLKRQILTLLKRAVIYTAINVHIEPFYYSVDGHHTPLLSPSAGILQQLYEFSKPRLEGATLTEIVIGITEMLVGKSVSLKNRLGELITYKLTEQQTKLRINVDENKITVVEAAPGCGKSVSAQYLCQLHGKGGHHQALFVCPRKAFGKIVKQNSDADVVVIKTDDDIKDLMDCLNRYDYHILIFDDIQAMRCSRDFWKSLLEKTYNKTKLVFLHDSRYQDFHQTQSIHDLRDCIAIFTKNRQPPSFPVLTVNMRNSRKIHSFLAAQHESVSQEFTCGHAVDGDDVNIEVIEHVLEDNTNNKLLQSINKVLVNKDVHRYEESEVFLMLADGNEEQVERLCSILRSHMNYKPHRADNVPHRGIVVDLVDEFVGMESKVVYVIWLHKSVSLKDIRHTIFVTSRGIMRVNLIIPTPFNEQKLPFRGIECLDAAEVRIDPSLFRILTMKYSLRSATVMLLDGIQCIVCVMANMINAYYLLTGDAATGHQPQSWRSADRPWLVASSREYAAVMCVTQAGGRVYLVKRAVLGIWERFPDYTVDFLGDDMALTDAGDLLLLMQEKQCLDKYDINGARVWSRDMHARLDSVTVSSHGVIYVTGRGNNVIQQYSSGGDRLPDILVARPCSICCTDSGRLLVCCETDSGSCVQVISKDGRMLYHLLNTTDAPDHMILRDNRYLVIAFSYTLTSDTAKQKARISESETRIAIYEIDNTI